MQFLHLFVFWLWQNGSPVTPPATNLPPVSTTQVAMPDSTETVAELSVLDLLWKGGIVMIPIVLLSIWAIYLIVERFIYINKNASINHNLVPTLRNHLQQGHLAEARQACENQNSSLGRILNQGLGLIGFKFSDIENSITDQADIEVAKMEQNLGYLGVIAGIAPMLGFVGTISGIIRIFYDISLQDNISIGIIAGGLYEKMITSGAGLIVGLMAYAGYHLLQAKIDRFALHIQEKTLQFKSILQQRV